MTEQKSNYRFDSLDLVVYIWKKRIPLILITVAAGIISIAASYLITPKFRSTVVIFPTSGVSNAKALMQLDYPYNMQAFGIEEQVESIMQVLQSEIIRDKIKDQYKLMEHYEIDPDEPHSIFRVNENYASNFQVKRTEYNSIVISFTDEDPQMAADIANSIAGLVDTTIWEIKLARATKAMEFLENEMVDAMRIVRILNDSINFFNKLGILNYDRQIERLVEAYGHSINSGNSSAAKRIEDEILKLENNSSDYSYYWLRYTHETGRLNNVRTQYLQMKAERESNLPAVFILDRAQVADKKASPNKSLIVMMATVSAFIMALLGFLFFENFLKRLKSA